MNSSKKVSSVGKRLPLLLWAFFVLFFTEAEVIKLPVVQLCNTGEWERERENPHFCVPRRTESSGVERTH